MIDPPSRNVWGHDGVLITEHKLAEAAAKDGASPEAYKHNPNDLEKTYGRNTVKECFICRLYKNRPYRTTRTCKHCGTSLCQLKRAAHEVDEGSVHRLYSSCLEEHMNSADHRVKCDKTTKRSRVICVTEGKHIGKQTDKFPTARYKTS